MIFIARLIQEVVPFVFTFLEKVAQVGTNLFSILVLKIGGGGHFEKKDPETGKFKWDGMAAAIKTFCEMGQICRINGYIALLGPTCGTPWVNSACTGT